MSNNINLDKVGSFNQVRAAGQAEVKKSGESELFRPVEAQKPDEADKLEFSNRGTEVGKMVEDLKTVPDVRQEKVAALRDQIATGHYDPSNLDIADAILKDEKI